MVLLYTPKIIHRPSSALKELLENALDAGSTSIKITAKEGGLKMLQIQDNGSGIHKADLPILCERFTTSKIKKFQDLSALTTYGFRGEALASISHVAHLSVITKTPSDSCAWRACYNDGVLSPPKPGQTAEPKPCAGNDGTQLTVEDLFYNVPTRLAALRSSADEYKRILDVVTQYAVHNPKVSLQCKKVGQAQSDVATPGNASVLQVIGLLYGNSLSKELIHVSLDKQKPVEKGSSPWEAEAYLSNPNYQSKRFTFLLFINHRLVESSRIKRAMEAVYTGMLPKGACPFVYLSLVLDPKDVDPNVHPTKREVHFLNEEAISEVISNKLQAALATQGSSRTFETQTLLTGGILDESSVRPSKRRRIEDGDDDGPNLPEEPRKVYSHYKVRTSLQDRTLDEWMPVAGTTSGEGAEKERPITADNDAAGDGVVQEEVASSRSKEIKESICRLTSVLELRAEVLTGRHKGMTEIMEKHIFVGIADYERCLSLLQHETKLYLVNHAALAEEFFYQLGLRQFGNFHRIKLDPPPPLRELVKLAVAADEHFPESGMDVDSGTDAIVEILTSRAEMLGEYFSLKITNDGLVQELPMLLRDYKPDLDKLPLFLMRLGPQVEWGSEKGCFDSFLRELAFFYIPDVPAHIVASRNDRLSELPSVEEDKDAEMEVDDSEEPPPGNEQPSKSGKFKDKEEWSAAEKASRWQIQHVLFPAMRRYFVPQKTLLDRDIVQIANLPDLYRVFERC
ncbi:DNA mismatch repair protein [Serendipita sp. 399]|nr:DNA mismatch repair protein [Serendipita sp. 399]